MTPGKVVCVALDAADKDLILAWAQEGLLPTFRALLDRAKWGVVQNPPGLYVGAVWPSFVTGWSPARHGRYCFQQLRSGTYEIERIRASGGQAEPFWAVLSRAHRRVAVIDVPKTRCMPLNGVQVIDWATHDAESSGFQTWPASLAERIGARFGSVMLRTCDGDYRSAGQYAALRDTLLARVQAKAALSHDVLAQGHWDLFLTTFAEAHCGGHQLWHLHDRTHPRHDTTIAHDLGDPLRAIYAALDAAVGGLLRAVDSDATVFVISSHGMGSHCDLNAMLDEILLRWEGIGPAAPRAQMPGWLQSVWQRVPSAVRAHLQPVRDRVVDQIERRATAIDGTRRCFAVPNNDVYGGIRVNLVGREPQGRIRPGHEYDTFCESLRADLCALRDIDSDTPAVRAVLRTSESYRGPLLDKLPDLLVEWNRDRPISGVTSPRVGNIRNTASSRRTGDHTAEGLFFAFGPSIIPGHITSPVSVMDFAPTFAALLDVSLEGRDGKSFAPLLTSPSGPAQIAVS